MTEKKTPTLLSGFFFAPGVKNILLWAITAVRLGDMFERILKFYTKYFAVWVILFGVVAYVWPGLFVSLKKLNETFFALTMFGIGAVLEIDDFKRIAKKPAIVLLGCIAQYSFMPIGGKGLQPRRLEKRTIATGGR